MSAQMSFGDDKPVEIVKPRPNPQVSVDAYHSSDRTAQRTLVEMFMRGCGAAGAIADDADAYFNCNPPKMWRRFAEMRHAGVLKLHPDGLLRRTRLGQMARVHVYVPTAERVVPRLVRIGPKAYGELRDAAMVVVTAFEEKDKDLLRSGIVALRELLIEKGETIGSD